MAVKAFAWRVQRVRAASLSRPSRVLRKVPSFLEAESTDEMDRLIGIDIDRRLTHRGQIQRDP